MANAPPQYSPAQILEAGQRAEADGRFEHAQQFYRHIVDHYPHSGEFSLARDGLGRLGVRGSWPGGHDDAQYARSYDHNAYAEPLQRGAPSARDGTNWANEFTASRSQDAARYDTSPDRSGYAAGTQPMPATDDRQRIQIAPSGYDPGEAPFDDEFHDPRRRYRFGRVLSGLLTFLGLVMLLGGGVLTGLMFAVPTVVTDRLDLTPRLTGLLVFVGPASVVFGFLVCLIGQLARALFDTADATRNAADLQAARLAARSAYARRTGES